MRVNQKKDVQVRAGVWTSALIFCVGIHCTAVSVQSRITGRFFGDVSVGGGYDSSVYEDARMAGSSYVPAQAGLGWRGRLTPATRLYAETRGYYRRYVKEPSETYNGQQVYVDLHQKLRGPLWLLLNLEGDLYRQPHLSQYNSNRILYRPGLELKLPWESRLTGGVLHEEESYSHYDLDSRGPGYFGSFAKDIGFRAAFVAAFEQKYLVYRERFLFLDTSGATTSQERKDKETDGRVLLKGRWNHFSSQLGYEWEMVKSNDNFLDYGPVQTSVPGDERLLPNYYSYTDQGPFVSFTVYPWRFLQVYASARWNGIRYEDRVARDIAEQLKPGDPVREDARQRLNVEGTWLRPWTERLTLGFTMGWFQEKRTSNDDLYKFTGDQVYAQMRAWF